MRPLRCILGFHKTELIKVFIDRGDVVFGRPSYYSRLKVSQCKRCLHYLFETSKIIHGALFYDSIWQPDLSEEDIKYIYGESKTVVEI